MGLDVAAERAARAEKKRKQEAAAVKKKQKDEAAGKDTGPIKLVGASCLAVGVLALVNNIGLLAVIGLASSAVCFFAAWGIDKEQKRDELQAGNSSDTEGYSNTELSEFEESSDTEEEVDKKDNWEGWFFDVERPYPVAATFRIEYEDGAGQWTKRTVDIRQFGVYQDSIMLIGRCRMRNETRTFKADRIKHCIDEETGEVVQDVAKYIKAKYENSPECSCEILLEKEYDFLRSLLYVGKADGQLRAAEKTLISEACRSLSNDQRITEKMVENILLSIDIPSIHSFKIAVGKIGKTNQEKLKKLHLISKDIIATQKMVHPVEQEAIDYIEKVLKKNSEPRE